jgi:nicotinate-nucleotide adenylyltransferase
LPAVGLLGGSFNPAHEGHRYISLQALKKLGLDEIWWMVSPQNPLKPVRGMAPFAERLEAARKIANHPRIKVTGIERHLGTRYTADTLRALKKRLPRGRFVWLMGADNLIEIPRWDEWAVIFKTVPIAVFDRPTYSLRARGSKAAQRFHRSEISPRRAKFLPLMRPPAWVFLGGRTNPASATSIRAARARKANRPNPGRAKKTANGRTKRTASRTARRR